jgi:hypothetical protein
MSKATCAPDERAKQAALMALPALWPAWPFLPLVRRGPAGEELGLMCDLVRLADRTGYSACVFFGNLFALPATLDDFLQLPKEVFDAPEEVFDAGWRVDVRRFA